MARRRSGPRRRPDTSTAAPNGKDRNIDDKKIIPLKPAAAPIFLSSIFLSTETEPARRSADACVFSLALLQEHFAQHRVKT